MSQEILIHITPKYLQVASVEDNQVQEIDMELHQTAMHVGDIYCAKVVRILLDMRAAFVEISSDRTALLHFADVQLPEGGGYTEVPQYLRVGQLLPVQISKLPRGEKGAVVTGHVQLVGALVIYQPFRNSINIAKRITDNQESRRLCDIIRGVGVSAGVMVRSLAQQQPAELIIQELKFLEEQWAKIQTALKEIKKPQVLRAESNLACTYIRERLNPNTEKIVVDDVQCYDLLKNYMAQGLQSWLPRLQKVKNSQSPWKIYKVDQIIKQAMVPNVSLPSGGHIIIERTEAMTVVDVNTGTFVKAGNDIIYQTNKEAAKIIGQQIRLRNIGGLIVVDFIRMRDALQQEEVLAILRATLTLDSVPTMLYGFSPLGLVEMSRQRQGNSWVDYYTYE